MSWRIVVLAPLGALLLAACGTATVADAPGVERARASVAVSTEDSCRAGSFKRLVTRTGSFALVVPHAATAYRRRGRGPIARFGAKNVNGAPTVFGVLGAYVTATCEPTWFHVQLPMKPNGITGYVRARDVRVLSVPTRIEIDISQRRVTLFRNGEEVMSATAAVGSPATPTPTGRYYVNQRLIPEDTSGPFGPGAIGISAFSNVLTGWAQGGPIAIHGTNQPWSVGHAVSNGCLRLPNDVLRRMFAATVTGTPVTIHP